MRIQYDAINVLQRTSQYLKHRVLTQQPAWYKVVAQHPPIKDLTKKVKTERDEQEKKAKLTQTRRSTLYKTKVTPKHYQNKLFKISKLHFVEDELRQLFYDQHPWEKATPKNLIENPLTNDDALNWNTMLQKNQRLDGESVVQRTLYLVQANNELTILEAYDQARFEFYRLRMERDLELTVSQEESTMNGAVFDKSVIEKGFDMEQRVLSNWKEDAIQKTKEFEARMSQSSGKANADSNFGGENSSDSALDLNLEDSDSLDISELGSFSDLGNSKR